MKRKEIAEGIVEKVDYPNRGRILAEDGTKVTVKNVIPGQKVRYRIIKAREGRAEGHLLETLAPSPLETREKACGIFPSCGGCLYQTVPYEEQLKIKSAQVTELLAPYFDEGTVFEGIVKSPEEFGYRNKMEFSFGNEVIDGPLNLGLHRRGTTYDVLTADTCRLVHSDMTGILGCVLSYCRKHAFAPYNKMKHTGFLRYLLIRRAHGTGEILVCLVTTSQEEHDFRPLAEEIAALPLAGKLAGILHATSDNPSDNVTAEKIETLSGRDWFFENLLGMTFRVSLFSFFQTNTAGAEILYRIVRDYVGGEENGKILYDLYCGTGTIAQLMSKDAAHVYGIELVPEAVSAARENAAMNGITDCTFLCGDVQDVLSEIREKPDFIILDPPREGIVPKALMQIIAYQVPKMVYISCKASSFVKDMRILRSFGWRIERCCLVDLFPQTQHVETVVLMSRVKGK